MSGIAREIRLKHEIGNPLRVIKAAELLRRRGSNDSGLWNESIIRFYLLLILCEKICFFNGINFA